jgi:hypothetical protein
MTAKFAAVFANIESEKREQVLDSLRIYNEACRKTERGQGS